MHRVHYVENIQLLLCATCTVSGGRTATQKGGGLEEAGRAQDSKSTWAKATQSVRSINFRFRFSVLAYQSFQME